MFNWTVVEHCLFLPLQNILQFVAKFGHLGKQTCNNNFDKLRIFITLTVNLCQIFNPEEGYLF